MSGLTDKANPQKKYDVLWMGVDVGSTTVKSVVIDAATDRHLLTKTYERNMGDVLDLQNEIAQAVAGDNEPANAGCTSRAKRRSDSRPPGLLIRMYSAPT